MLVALSYGCQSHWCVLPAIRPVCVVTEIVLRGHFMLLLLHTAGLTASWKGCERKWSWRSSTCCSIIYLEWLKKVTVTSGCPVLAIFELATSLICTGVSPSQPECFVHSLEWRGSKILEVPNLKWWNFTAAVITPAVCNFPLSVCCHICTLMLQTRMPLNKRSQSSNRYLLHWHC